ncbi:MAG TPA: MBL fold metallo-hydrolase [Verrucomicrobiae bacterium]|nr:MBL fold metallo-hydrolase [Verrucomicrobiae bacterium]
MKITKYGHACMVIEEQGKNLVIDPNIYAADLPSISNVVAIVITHAHGDHYSPELVARILSDNPGAVIYGTSEVVAVAEKNAIKVTAVEAGQSVETTSFQITFFGGRHAYIFKETPQNENVGMLVNGKFYYPGDSFDTPGDIHPEVLALPVSGPWLKIGEAMEFLAKVAPTKLCIPTHDGMLSQSGLQINERMLPAICEQSGATLQVLKSGESVDV